MKTQEKSYTLISQNVAFNMGLRDEIDTQYSFYLEPWTTMESIASRSGINFVKSIFS